MRDSSSTARRSGGSVAAHGVDKAFGGVAALRDVDLELPDGHALGLVGENGAGKSTLINILTGALQPDHGTVSLDGEPTTFKSPNDALMRGIGTVHQQNWLVPRLTVLENLDLGEERTHTILRILSKRARATSEEALEFVGLTAKGRRPVGELSLADRQLVAVARACARGTRLIVFDEPTAALSPHETRRLFEVIDRLRTAGRSVLYVTHRLEELARTVEQITVMRAGQVVAVRPSGESEQVLIELIAGASMPEAERQTVATRRRQTAHERDGDPILVGDGLSDSRGAFRDVSVSLRAGEVLALVGLPDSGAVELVQALAGARRLQSGRLSVDGTSVVATTPRDALRKKIGYLPGDRKRNGIIPNSTLAETLTLSALDQVSRWGWVSRSQERALVDELVMSCDVRAATPQLPITALSGGNQQKALFARTIATRPRVIVCEDPTAGVDPGGRESLYELLAQACAGGAGVVIYSSDLREVCTLSDRAIVLWRGSCITELGRTDLSIPTLMSAQFNQPISSGTISG